MLFMMAFSVTQAQPEIQWENNLGGSALERAQSIEQTENGGYLVAGWSNSSDGDVSGNNDDSDYWIVKLDKNGQLEWENSLGGSDSEEAYDIEQTEDGGYVVAGVSASSDGDVGGNKGEEDYWIVKLDKTGQLEWENNLGGSGLDRAWSIEQTQDGGFVVAGESKSSDGDVSGNKGEEDYWIVKLDETGQLEWENNLGGSREDRARSIEQTEDGGFIVAGLSKSSDGDVGENNGEGDYWIVKLNANGQLDWENSFGGSKFDQASSIQQTEDDGYVVAGESQSSNGDVRGNNGGRDYWILKLDATGQLEWENTFGGSGWDRARSIEQTGDSGFVVAGWSASKDGDASGNNGDTDYWIVKLDVNGQLDWEQNLGGSTTEFAFDIKQTEDGCYVVAGESLSKDGDIGGNKGAADYWVVKLKEIVDINLGPDTTICEGDSLVLSVNTLAGDSLSWNTGNTTEQIIVREPGTYHATIRADDTVISDTVEVSFAPKPQVYVGPSQQSFCGQIDTTLDPETKNAQTYRWNTGDTTKTLYVDEEGRYWLRVESEESCANADTTELKAIAYPESLDSSEITACQERVELDAGNSGASHQWNTGDTTQTLTVRSDGRYTVKIANQFCTIRDTVQVKVDVEEACPYLWVPNSFSPNGDGLNDVFKPKAQKVSDYQLTIYNRWGERVFQSAKVSEGWDGTIDGKRAAAGVYLYQMVYKLRNEEGTIRLNTKEGTVQLIR
jgi:gliding motility-associated-like protein